MNDADFRQLILAELDAVVRLACHLTRSRTEADDVVQETYLRALRSSHTFQLASFGVRPWLFKILHNVISTRGARTQREHEVMNEHRDAMSPNAADGDVAASVQGSSIDWDHVDERLKVAVAELSLPFRTTFLLSAVEGLTYHQIADVTQVPVGTVMSRISRARAALAKRLSEFAAEQGIGRVEKRVSMETPLSE